MQISFLRDFQNSAEKVPEQLDLILKPNLLGAGGWTRLPPEVPFQPELFYKSVILYDSYLGLSYLKFVQSPKCYLELNF